MGLNELIFDKETFSALRRDCETVVDTRKRLPDFVFQNPFTAYFVVEYGNVYRAEFGSFLYQMAVHFGDKSVNYMTLDPDPGDDYFKQLAHFGGASFKPSAMREQYVTTMYLDRGIPGFLVSANVGAFWGSSLKWAIMCDRVSWEIAVIAVSDDVDVETISGFRCMSGPALSDYIKSQYAAKSPSFAVDFSRTFSSSFGI